MSASLKEFIPTTPDTDGPVIGSSSSLTNCLFIEIGYKMNILSTQHLSALRPPLNSHHPSLVNTFIFQGFALRMPYPSRVSFLVCRMNS